jgi:hypothetical protein
MLRTRLTKACGRCAGRSSLVAFFFVATLALNSPAAAQDLPTWAATFKAARQRLPGFQAEVTEKFIVTRPSANTSDSGFSVSWGDTNATRTLIVNYLNGNVSISCQSFSGKPLKGIDQDFKYVLKDGYGYSTVSKGHQGTIDTASESKELWMPDCLFGFYNGNGVPYDRLAVEENATVASHDSSTTVSYPIGGARLTLYCDPAHSGRVVKWTFSEAGQNKTVAEVTDWVELGGLELPRSVVTTWFDRGIEQKRLETTIAYWAGGASLSAFDPGWAEGAIVRDNAHFRFYRVVHGALVEDKQLTAAWNNTMRRSALLVTFGVIALASGCIVLAMLFRKRRLKALSNPAR